MQHCLLPHTTTSERVNANTAMALQLQVGGFQRAGLRARYRQRWVEASTAGLSRMERQKQLHVIVTEAVVWTVAKYGTLDPWRDLENLGHDLPEPVEPWTDAAAGWTESEEEMRLVFLRIREVGA